MEEQERRFIYHYCDFCDGTGRKRRDSGRDGLVLSVAALGGAQN